MKDFTSMIGSMVLAFFLVAIPFITGMGWNILATESSENPAVWLLIALTGTVFSFLEIAELGDSFLKESEVNING